MINNYADLYETLMNEYGYLWDEWDNESEEKAQLVNSLLKTAEDECHLMESGDSNFQTLEEVLEAARKKMDAIEGMTGEEAGAEMRYYQRNNMDMPLHYEAFT